MDSVQAGRNSRQSRGSRSGVIGGEGEHRHRLPPPKRAGTEMGTMLSY